MAHAVDIRSLLQRAMTLHQQGDAAQAEGLYQHVLRHDPREPNAWHLLGVAAWQRGDLATAETNIRKAIGLHAKASAYHNNLAGILKQKGDLQAAIASYESALRLAPQDESVRKALGETLHQYGYALAQNTRWDEAKTVYRRVLVLEPDNIPTLNNLATIFQNLNDRAMARELYAKALRVQPDNLQMRYNRAICHLTEGNFQDGWADFDASLSYWRGRMDPRENLPWVGKPLWDGREIANKKILIWGDQGIGDEILYASLIPDLLERGADLTIETAPRLVPLFARSFPSVKSVARQEKPVLGDVFDFHAPWLWLARCLRPDAGSFPKREKFLVADPDKTRALRERYRTFGKKQIIGVSWFTKSASWGLYRSAPLPEILSSLPLADCLVIDLQYGDTAAAWGKAREAFPDLCVFHDPDIDQFTNMDSYAAQVAVCDSVLTICNTTSHVAGALGVPATVLMSDMGLTWYWFDKGEKCPWYPSLNLTRRG